MRTRTLPLFGDGPPNGVAHNRKIRVFYTIRRVSRASCSANRRNDVQAVHIEKCSIELIERHSWRDAIEFRFSVWRQHTSAVRDDRVQSGTPSCTIPPRARVVVPVFYQVLYQYPATGAGCAYTFRVNLKYKGTDRVRTLRFRCRPPARYIQQTILNAKRASK